MRVCLLLEGSYPYITGGVSSWMQDLIENLPDIEFVLFTISPKHDQSLKYELPPNVVEHRDIVLSDIPESVRRPRSMERVLGYLRDFHDGMPTAQFQGIEQLIGELPEGCYLHRDVVDSDIGWNLLTDSNNQFNPIYPFTDFFWAWRSAYNMIFTILGTPMPEADLYHAISTGYAGLAALAARIRKRRPFLLTEHGLYHKEREMELRKATFVRGYQRDLWIGIYYQLSRAAYHLADFSTSLFEANRQIQISMGTDDRRSVVIPNGIDVERFSSVERKPRPGFHVGLVGRVVPIKDIKTFITMAKIIHTTTPEAEFHCIGPTDEDPGYYEECVRLVENYRLEHVFHFSGRQNVRDYYGFLDVLLLTSVREAQPLVILEAFAAGVPVVSTDVGNVAEMLDFDHRFLAPPKDAEVLARGVRYVMSHPEEMRDLIAKNRIKVETFYNKTKLYDTYRELYRELAGRTG